MKSSSKEKKAGMNWQSWRPHLVWLPVCVVTVCVAYLAGQQSSTRTLKAPPLQTRLSEMRLDRESAAFDHEENVPVKEAKRSVLHGEEARARAFDVLSEPNRITRFTRLGTLLEQVTTDNWREVLDAFVRQTGYEGRRQRQEWELALERVGQVAGADAITEILESPRPREHQWAQLLVMGWAEANPKDAAKWFSTQPSDTQEQLRGNLLTGIARTDAKYALSLIMGEPTNTWNDLMPSIVMASIQHGGFREGEELLRTISSRPDVPVPLKSAVFKTLAEDKSFSGFVRDDPSLALAWFDGYVGEEYVGPNVTRDIVMSIATSDAQGALKWLEDRSERLTGAQATAGFGAVGRTWVLQSPEQFTEWMNSNRTHPQHDTIAENAVNVLREYGYMPLARRWLETIVDPQIRARTEQTLQRTERENRPPQ